MKKYTFTIIFSIIVIALHYFHFKVEKTITGWTGMNLALYIIYGLFLAFFLVLLFKAFSKSNLELGAWLLTLGVTGFFLFSQPVFLFKLSMLELFLVGFIPAVEGKKARSVVPFLIIIATAVLAHVVPGLSAKIPFSYLEAWRNTLMGLCGYIAGCLLV
jgi:hypothetical protein